MTQLTIKQSELPFLLVAIILLTLIYNDILDDYPWIIYATIIIIPTWITLRRNQQKNATE